MGQQLNKIQKRRRRANYLERQKVKAKTRPVAKPAGAPAAAAKKKPAPKKEKAPAAAAPAATE